MKLLRYYHLFINYIESGDIILPLILIATVHYGASLAQYDYWFVAASIGFLVDIGHYRVVKLYYSGKGSFWAIVLTIWSFFMHWFYYWEAGAGWWSIPLAATIPLTIFALGWITRTQRLDEKVSRTVSREAVDEKKSEISPETLKDEKYDKIQEIMEKFSVSRSTAYRRYEHYLDLLKKNKQNETV